MSAAAHMSGMHTAASAGSRRLGRRTDRSSPGGVGAATDVCLARERLAVMSRLSEHAATQVDRAEFALVDALRDHRAGAAGIEAARRRLVDAQDAALGAPHDEANKVIAAQNGVTDLGTITLPIDGK